MLPVHPIAELLPLIEGDEWEAFKADIEKNGVREPAWTYQGQIIDGRNRARACKELGIELPTREWDGGGSLAAFILSNNLHRRHLSAAQRATTAVKFLPHLEAEAREQQREGGRKNGGDKVSQEAQKRDEERLPASLPEAAPEERKPTCREDREARGMAAKLTGASPRYVSDAKRVFKSAPDVFAKLDAGELTIPQAVVEVKRREKREELARKAAEVDAAAEAEAEQEGWIAESAPGSFSGPGWSILAGEVGTDEDPLRAVAPGSARLVFADPPYNIGFDYGEGHDDKLPAEQYLAWCERWLVACRDLLTPDGALWVLINDEWAAEFGVILKRIGMHRRNWVIWYETFGVNCSDKFNRTKRHLFYTVRDPKKWCFNFDAVKRPSNRQERGDARANPDGKVHDDVWLDIPRLHGTATERMPGFPTQLPVALLLRIVGACSDPNDLVIDPFNGSGTTGAAAIELGRRYVGVERSNEFRELAAMRLKGLVKRAS